MQYACSTYTVIIIIINVFFIGRNQVYIKVTFLIEPPQTHKHTNTLKINKITVEEQPDYTTIKYIVPFGPTIKNKVHFGPTNSNS